jgi:hypothetical protein
VTSEGPLALSCKGYRVVLAPEALYADYWVRRYSKEYDVVRPLLLLVQIWAQARLLWNFVPCELLVEPEKIFDLRGTEKPGPRMGNLRILARKGREPRPDFAGGASGQWLSHPPPHGRMARAMSANIGEGANWGAKFAIFVGQ